MRFRFLALPVAAVLLAAGCTPGNGTPTPTPTPSLSFVASPSPISSPSSGGFLYAEADRVLRAAISAQSIYQSQSEQTEFPIELAEYYSPEALEGVRFVTENFKSKGLILEGGEPVVRTESVLNVVKEGSVVVLDACIDSSALSAIGPAGEVVATGKLAVGRYFFRHIDGALKIFEIEPQEVSECPFG